MTNAVPAPAPAASGVWATLRKTVGPVWQRPQVVDGIESVEHTTRSGRTFVMIKNPATGTYAQIDPREHELLGMMDGTRNVRDLVVFWFEKHHSLAAPRVIALVQVLAAQKFLVREPLDAYAELGRRIHGPVRVPLLERLTNVFMFGQIAVSGLDRHFTNLYRWFGRALFNPVAVVLQVALAVGGGIAAILARSRHGYAFADSGSAAAPFIVGLVLSFVIGVIVHEMGHGLAVKRAGRSVPRGGLLLYLGLPGAFVDTADIWMASRQRRIVTSIAGPWSGFVLGGACGVLAWVLPEGGGGSLLYSATILLFVLSLVNLNPLIELDGYYLASDYLDNPALRQQAIAYVRGPLWAQLRSGKMPKGGELLLALFGLASMLFPFLVLVVAVVLLRNVVVRPLLEAWEGGDTSTRVLVACIAFLVAVPVLAVGRGMVRNLASMLTAPIRQALLRLDDKAREVVPALRAVPLFSTFPEGRLRSLAEVLRRERVRAGVAVVRQGEVGDRFFVIASGSFEVVIDGVATSRLGPGDYFGERALLGDGRRTATVIARDDGIVYSLDRSTFEGRLAPDMRDAGASVRRVEFRQDLGAMPLFEGMSPVELDLLIDSVEEVDVRAGRDVFHAGDPGDAFYIVRSGRVGAFDGDELVREMTTGGTFGEIALLSSQPRTLTVRALDDTQLLALDSDEFHDLLARYCHREQVLEQLSTSRLNEHRGLAASAPKNRGGSLS